MHNIVIWGSAGSTKLNTNSEFIRSFGGGGIGGGLGYEVQKNNFIFHLGGEFVFGNSSMEIDDFQIDVDLIDTEGDRYVGHYDFTENTDKYKLGMLNIPIMFGMQLGQKAYFLAGGKIGINAFTKSSTLSNVVSTGTYPEFIDDFGNMPNHFFGEYEETADFDLELNTNFSLSAEFGIYLSQPRTKTFSSRVNTAYRLAFFVDYGLANLHDNAQTGQFVINKLENVGGYQPAKNSFMLTEKYNDQFLNSFYAGLKFTFLLGWDSKRDCNCIWY